MEDMVKRPDATHQRYSGDLEEFYKTRRCFVTGHTGFKGSWLCLWLLRLEAKIVGYALDPPTVPSLFNLAEIGASIEDVRGDIRDYELLAGTIRQFEPEIVFHLAAQPIVRLSYDQPKATFDVNVAGTVNLLEALRHCPTVKGIVVITSDKCYQNQEWPHAYRETDPLGGRDPYSASKAAAEMVCTAYEHSYCSPKNVGLATCRAGNVIGGGDWAVDRIIPDIVRALQTDTVVKIRNPLSTRPWQHVLEPLYGYLLLGSKLFGNQRFSGKWNFGPHSDSCRPVSDLVNTFLAAFGKGSWEHALPEQQSAPHEAGLLALAWDKAFRLIGWKPRWNFEETVRHTSTWYSRYAGGDHSAQLCLEQINDYAENV